MLVQDAGEIPIGLCVYDKTLTWWLSALLILSLLTVGVQVGFMLLGTLGNGGPGDGGGSGRGLIPCPPDPTPLASRIQFKQVVHAHGAGLETGTGASSRCASERKVVTCQQSLRGSAHVIRQGLAALTLRGSVQRLSGRY
jgi:hypothetical protein